MRRILALLLLAACTQAEAGHGRDRGHQRPSTGGRFVPSAIAIEEGLGVLVVDGTEGTSNYNAFPGLCLTHNAGAWVVPFRDSTNHGVQFNTSSIDQIDTTNSGLSWEDQTQETTIVAANAGYDPYSPSCTRLAAANTLILQYEKDWTTPYPAGNTIATTAVTITTNVARATVADSTGWQNGEVITTTGHTSNASHVAIVAVPDSTHIDYPLVGADGPLADGVGTIGSDQERTVHVRVSTDNGANWGAEVNMCTPAGSVVPHRRYTSAGGPIIQLGNGDLIALNYYRQYNQLRYSTYACRSVDGGANWTFLATVTQDSNTGNSTTPGNWGLQMEEPNCFLIDADSIGCLVRVDDAAGTLGDNALDAWNYWTRSDDSGATWSAYAQAFQGNGWPSITRMTNGIVVATTRDNFDTGGFVNRPTLWVNSSVGATGWQGPRFYGDNSLANPRYMYSGIFEHPAKTNVLANFYGQEVTANNSNRLAYIEFGIGASAQLPTYRSTRSALWGNANNTYITYDSDTFLNGATSAVFLFRIRYDANAGGTQNLFSRGTADAQERFRMTGGDDFDIGFATAATTYATETYNDTVFPLDRNTCGLVLFDGNNVTAADRARLWYGSGNANPVEDTTPDVTSGTMPATLRTSATNFWLGASGAATGSNPRQMYFGELVIWANPNVATAVANVNALCNRGVSFDYSTSALGAPSVWIRMDGNFVDSQGVLDNPTLTGSDVTHSNIWTFGGGYLAP